MKRIYIAGPLTGADPAEYLDNCGRMFDAWLRLTEAGFAAYCPAADLLAGFIGGARSRPLSAAQFKAASMAWLEASDAVYVIAHYRRDGTPSPGVRAELERAELLGIPVFADLGKLFSAFGTRPSYPLPWDGPSDD